MRECLRERKDIFFYYFIQIQKFTHKMRLYVTSWKKINKNIRKKFGELLKCGSFLYSRCLKVSCLSVQTKMYKYKRLWVSVREMKALWFKMCVSTPEQQKKDGVKMLADDFKRVSLLTVK
ncbi:hypothetical protein AMECASPLE_037659 [Ameca splendens]|uniref:Uncharacterized protein n=1 Tax=Ameca splendens TaxID=208324 RepID=A0ABV0YV18_9TELE